MSVVRKRLKSLKNQKLTEAAFEKENVCLVLLRSLRHNNIIELLGSYTCRGQHNFIFPVLPMDLAEFLDLETRYELFKYDLTFYNALHGLASAIEVIHNLRIQAQRHQETLTKISYHHDIRPKNILVTQSTFILADFGLARFKGADEDSKTPWKSGVGDHIAPECMDNEFNSLDVGRSMDIWSLGCMIANIATYMEQGPSGVRRFQEKRFYEDKKKKWKHHYFFQDTQVKQSVLSWFDGLDRKAQDGGIRCLTAMVRAMLQIQEEDRPNASILCRRFCYVSCKTSFRTIIELIKIVSHQLTDSKNRHATLFMMDFQYCMAMLRAWGRVFAMDTDQICCDLFEDGSRTGESFKITLDQLYCDVQKFLNDSIKGTQRSLEALNHQTNVLLTLHPMNEKFRQSVHNLFKTVPQIYQKRMLQECRLAFLDGKDEKKLQRIEDNTHLFAPDSEIGAFAALKRL